MAESQILNVIRMWAAIAWADGVLAEPEAEGLRRLIRTADLTPAEREAATAMVEQRVSLPDSLAAPETLTPEAKRGIYRAACRMAVMDHVFAASELKPAVNQVEAHPYLTQDEVRAFGAEHGIVTEAWAPIARGKVTEDPVIRGVAEEVGRTPAQVTLRWHVQRGDVVFPKSVTRSRIEENFAIFDFELTPEQMTAISALDRGERTGPNPDEMNRVPS